MFCRSYSLTILYRPPSSTSAKK